MRGRAVEITRTRVPEAAPAKRRWSGYRARLCAPRNATRLLLGVGVLFGLVLLAGLVLPLSIPANPRVFPEPAPPAIILGRGWSGALRLALPLVLLLALFVAALAAAARACGRRAALVVLAGTALFSVALLPMNPVAAGDVFHNVSDARTLWVHGRDPAVYPPDAFPNDPFLKNVATWRSTPSAYGPLWYDISGLPLPLAGTSLWPNVLGQKLIMAALLFAATLLAMKLAERTGANAVLAGVLVGWNPLLQWETAGNAHNDVLMVAFALGALLAVTRRRSWLLVFPLLALSIASKSVLVVLGPVLLVWMLRQRRTPWRRIALSLALGAAVLAVVYAPVFEGIDTILALNREAGHVTSSPGAIAHVLIWEQFNINGVRILHGMQLVLYPIFAVAFGVLLWRIPRDADAAALLRASFWTVFLVMVLLTWWFMPWYLFWLVPLAAPLRSTRLRTVAVAFSAGALLVYVPHMWLLGTHPVLFEGTEAAVVFLPALAAALLPLPRRRARSVQTAALLAAAD